MGTRFLMTFSWPSSAWKHGEAPKLPDREIWQSAVGDSKELSPSSISERKLVRAAKKYQRFVVEVNKVPSQPNGLSLSRSTCLLRERITLSEKLMK
ncbi:putative protein STRUBBELIG-RECEPTOR FAMILY 7 isoform X6 [Iris pallida]|uniref:Uncharacterized protein n=1 Tax=Iris pallida TaxID=29817 RepID=A0AAX6E7N7_IRIPA|nr:putative protein STRUBBELIG-RECEPTOR FAMILY 7 isoform X6 [Iris pallida]